MNKYECKIQLKNKVIRRIIEADTYRTAFHQTCLEADTYGELALSISAKKIQS